MILSITMNPSIDIVYHLPQFQIDDINRVQQVNKTAGGKGLNVARGIHLAGFPVLATGIIGGTTGTFIRNQLTGNGIKHNFYQTRHESRNCIAILHQDKQTEILEPGPEFSKEELDGCLDHIKALIKQAQIITISGSVSPGTPLDYYCDIIQAAHQQNKKVLLDCSGKILRHTLAAKVRPFLIKPNQSELEELIGSQIRNWNEEAAKKITANPFLADIFCIVISLGKEGAFVKYDKQFYKVEVPKINVVNSVGSGDVTLGGLAIGLSTQGTIEAILKRAMTMGMLNAMEQKTGCIDLKQFDHYFDQVRIYDVRCVRQ